MEEEQLNPANNEPSKVMKKTTAGLLAVAFLLGGLGGLGGGYWILPLVVGSNKPVANTAAIVTSSLSTLSQMFNKLSDLAKEKEQQKRLAAYGDMASLFSSLAGLASLAGENQRICLDSARPYPFTVNVSVESDWNSTCSAFNRVVRDVSGNQVTSSVQEFVDAFNALMWTLIEVDNHIHSDP